MSLTPNHLAVRVRASGRPFELMPIGAHWVAGFVPHPVLVRQFFTRDLLLHMPRTSIGQSIEDMVAVVDRRRS